MKILVIDDEVAFCREISEVLEERGHSCQMAHDGESGLEQAATYLPEIVLCDLVMPGIGGLEVLERARTQLPDTHFIMITARGTLHNAIDAFRLGAIDYVLKPPLVEDLLQKIARVAERKALVEENRRLRRLFSHPLLQGKMVGESPPFREVRLLTEKAAGVDASVLLLGSTGTGKEVVAQEIHRQSRRREGPFVPVNCAGIPENLVESELFGHAEGAFTGAVRDRQGLFHAAGGGTIFLDEICSMPIETQARVLRVLEDRTITRVGGTERVQVDVRLITSSRRELAGEVEKGNFREDLYFRVRVMEIRLPELRERREDIPLLAQHFVAQMNTDMKREVEGVSSRALQALMLYAWPGNVRELRNAVERSMIFREDGFIELDDFPPEISGHTSGAEAPDDLRAAVKAYELTHINAILKQVDGNREEAAKRLGIGRSTLFRKLEELGGQADGSR